MKSTDVYKVLRHAIGPWAKANGFARAKSGFLAFVRPEHVGFLVLWCQCSQNGWDQHAGSKLVVEFQTSPSDRPGAGGASSNRMRIGALLCPEDLERARRIQNGVIRKLPPLSKAFVAALPEEVRYYYLAQFEPELGPYTERSDVWLRYYDEGDVRRWGEFISEVLPGAVSRIAATYKA